MREYRRFRLILPMVCFALVCLSGCRGYVVRRVKPHVSGDLVAYRNKLEVPASNTSIRIQARMKGWLYCALAPTIIGPEAYRNYVESKSVVVDFHTYLQHASLALADNLLRRYPRLRLEVKTFRSNYSQRNEEVELGLNCVLRDQYRTVLSRSFALVSAKGDLNISDDSLVLTIGQAVRQILDDLLQRTDEIESAKAISDMTVEELERALTADARRHYKILFPGREQLSLPPKHIPYFDPRKTKCVIVGISDYREKKLKLKYARDDALRFFSALVDPSNKMAVNPSNVALMLDEKATAAKVRAVLNRFLSGGEQSDAIIYWSGHGGLDEDRSGGAPDGFEKYLLPWDCSVDTDFNNNAISMSEVGSYLQSKSFQRVMVVLDTCYSGGVGERGFNRSKGVRGIAGVADPTKMVFDSLDSTTCRVLVAACKANQLAHELSDLKAGLFSHYLVQGIRDSRADGNKDGYVDVGELIRYVLDRVKKKSKELGVVQEPIVRIQEATSLAVALSGFSTAKEGASEGGRWRLRRVAIVGRASQDSRTDSLPF